MTESLYAVSPLDGRYAGRTAPLSPYASEAGLMRARIRVEVEYLIALADLDETELGLDTQDRATLRALYKNFTEEDAKVVKQLETEGYAGYSATNHDVKAVEYFVRHRLPDDMEHVSSWIHFGLTSEDVNNLAHRLLVRDAMEEVIVPELTSVQSALTKLAREYRDV
ncbi:MAG TPA: lyase family protein, partial [Natronoarchaeum rubrum]|nr:lyase family protein [Natronoarchaeum rubrum]